MYELLSIQRKNVTFIKKLVEKRLIIKLGLFRKKKNIYENTEINTYDDSEEELITDLDDDSIIDEYENNFGDVPKVHSERKCPFNSVLPSIDEKNKIEYLLNSSVISFHDFQELFQIYKRYLMTPDSEDYKRTILKFESYIHDNLASFSASEMLEVGEFCSNMQRVDLAEKLYKEGIKFNNPVLFYRLATIYHYGIQGFKNDAAAEELYRKAALLGNESAKEHVPGYPEYDVRKKREAETLEQKRKEREESQKREDLYRDLIMQNSIDSGRKESTYSDERSNTKYDNFRGDYENNCDNHKKGCQTCWHSFNGKTPYFACKLYCGKVVKGP